jgi:hypothetical protein
MPKFEYRALLIGVLAAAAILLESKLAIVAVCLALLACLAGPWLLAGRTRWVAVFFCATILLPPFPIAFGNSGPHPAVVVALIGLFAGLLYLREWRLSFTPVTNAILLLTTVIFCSLGAAALYAGPVVALESLFRALLFAISVYIFFFAYSGPGSPAGTSPEAPGFSYVRLLFGAAVVAALFACFDFYYQLPAPAGFSPQFVWLDSGVFRRAQGLFYDASTLGNFCAFFLVMIGISIVRPAQERPLPLWWMIGGGAILAAAVLLSYSRASVVNLLVSAGALWLLRKKTAPSWRPLVVVVASTGLACFLCYLFVPALFSAYGYRLWNSVVYSASSTNGILSGRLDSWRTIASFLIANPWQLLTGVGYKTLPYSDFTGAGIIADNAYLSAIAETGLVGFLALLFFLAAVLQTAYRGAKDADPCRSFFGAWSFCFWCGQAAQMFSGDLLTYWRVLPIYLWVLALAAR